MKELNLEEFRTRPFQILDQEWALLVSGRKPNPMTVSWGGFGTLWNKPVVTVYVRPTRYTYGLLNESKEFTLNFLGEKYRAAMDLCGTKSGRDIDKWAATDLHQLAGGRITVPRISEAHLAFECHLLAHQDFDPKKFVAADVEGNYPNKDYHRIYWGEVVGLWSRA
jgi:flavin reductase (DIM6/NTAB) family NADH-FMN oxidoreductase RutF